MLGGGREQWEGAWCAGQCRAVYAVLGRSHLLAPLLSASRGAPPRCSLTCRCPGAAVRRKQWGYAGGPWSRVCPAALPCPPIARPPCRPSTPPPPLSASPPPLPGTPRPPASHPRSGVPRSLTQPAAPGLPPPGPRGEQGRQMGVRSSDPAQAAPQHPRHDGRDPPQPRAAATPRVAPMDFRAGRKQPPARCPVLLPIAATNKRQEAASTRGVMRRGILFPPPSPPTPTPPQTPSTRGLLPAPGEPAAATACPARRGSPGGAPGRGRGMNGARSCVQLHQIHS